MKATPLHNACGQGSFDIVMLLLKRGADIMAVDMGGMTPMHVACSQGKQEVSLRYSYVISSFKRGSENTDLHIYIFPVTSFK